jgi:hypothetical protein
MKEYYFAIIKFPLLVSLSLVILTGSFFGIALGSYFKLGLSLWDTVLYTALFIVLVVLIFSWILNLISPHRKIQPSSMAIYAKWMLFHVFYYIAKALGKITFQKDIDLQESFLNFNNEIVLSAAANISHRNILLLLPHCLQRSDCDVRITSDINSCKDCGRCDITDIKILADKYQVKAAVATGGSLARKLIKDLNPDVIVAVACHRDLIAGVRDTWKVPIYAVLNERPKGPCFETTVSTKTIEFAIKKFQ